MSGTTSEDDLNNLEQNDDDDEEVVFKTKDQLKFETLLLRLSKVCLLCSALLFVGQIIAVATRHQSDTSSAVTGFIFSLILFLVWLCIHSVYGESNEGLMSLKQTAFMQPSRINFRLRSIEEMRLIMPHRVCYVFFIKDSSM